MHWIVVSAADAKCSPSLPLQPIKDELLGRLASEVDWINAEELGLCTFLASESDGR